MQSSIPHQIKLIRELPPLGLSSPASDKTVQRTFLKMLGLVNKDINIDETNLVITAELSELLAIANSHDYYKLLFDPRNRDGYYTKQESDKAYEHVFEHGTQTIPKCMCKAHESIETITDHTEKDSFCRLIRIPSRMNNDRGKTFIISLVSLILRYSGRTEMSITSTEQGTEWSVNYMLMDSSTSEIQAFRGWPDFCITENTVGAGVMLVSIGEVQSHGDCLSQLGKYTIGQFRARNIPQNKLGCIAVFKDKTVNLAIGSINEEDIVSFELIHSAERIDLCETAGITKFSQILMATMMYIKI